MALFKIANKKVQKLLIKPLDLEKHLQEVFENNLEEILQVTFLAHEYSTSFGGRIDTLGIDHNGSPVIIEYKKTQNDNVINQGLSYLRWLIDHKADFELLCRSKKVSIQIDWDSPRVICIAESYNKFDLDTADILPITIELLKYKLYEEHLLSVEPENYQKVKISTSAIIKKAKILKEDGIELQKTYTIDFHLNRVGESIKALFYQLREKITALDDEINEEPKKKYIAYKTSTNFVDLEIQSKDIKVFLNIKSGELKDPGHLARDLANPKKIGHYGNGDYECRITNEEDLEKIMPLIKQSYEYNK